MKTIRIHDLDMGPSPRLAFDLKGILAALEPEARRAVWSVNSVEGEIDGLDLTGEAAAALEELAQSGERINGRHFAKLAENVRQVIWGEFCGYESTSSINSWIIIVAYDSTRYEVRSTDEVALARLQAAFKDVRAVP